jgi:hypothetical protein
MNKGIGLATGEIVNILNADDCFRPEALLRVGQSFQAHPEWDGLFGDTVFVDAQDREIYRREEAGFDYDVLRYSGICYVIHPTLFVKKSVYEKLGLFRYKEFLNACDYDFILSLGRARCRIGHLDAFLVNYRYHEYGQSADLRVTGNMAREAALIRRAHGVPDGLRGKFLRVWARGKRQYQKLRYRGKCDLLPGQWYLRKQMRSQTSFTSNIPMEKL